MPATPRTVEPPFYDPVIAESGDQHSQAWTEYHQAVADKLSVLNAGVTDGSDATAGDIGEYMIASSAPIGLANGVVANLASLSLTPGDWDVWGQVVFQAGSGSHAGFGVGINSVDAIMTATFPTTAIQQAMPTIQHRLNISAAATAWVVAQASFSGTMTATGTIQARRAR